MRIHFLFKFILGIGLLLVLSACVLQPTPEVIEITKIVEQTVEVPQIIKETVIVTETNPTPDDSQTDEKFFIPAEYFDAMVAVVQHYSFLETKQCEAYYDSFSEWGRPQNSKEDMINNCLSTFSDIQLISAVPYNYLLTVEGKNVLNEPDDLVFFVVNYRETLEGDINHERNVQGWISVVNENGSWKIGKGSTSPPQYSSEYWNWK